MTEAMEWLQARNWSQLQADCWLSPGPRMNATLEDFRLRDDFIPKFGFAVLTDHIVRELLPLSPFVEVGAGSGYWSYELRRAGAIAEPTDPQTGKYFFGGKSQNWPSPYCHVEKLTGVEAVAKYPHHTLLTVWPDMQPETWPYDTLAAYQGDTVIYVGESDGGCTADERFHKLLEERFDDVETLHVPQFWGIHDYLSIYRRKNRPKRNITLEKEAHGMPVL
jgi:hypothetical protein